MGCFPHLVSGFILFADLVGEGITPHGNRAVAGYLGGMNILLILVVLLLLFGGGGFYLGGPVIGGSALGMVLLICLVVFLAGGFRNSKS
jgi:hypothetical protein